MVVKNFLPDDSDAFQKQALQAEEMGKWPKAWLNIAAESKLWHLAVPEKYDGHGLPLPELMTVFEEAAKLDGSFGWSLTLGAGAGPFTAYMDPDFVREHFSNPQACIAGTGFPGGTFKETDEGVIASGYWKYITGAPHATLFTAACKEAEGEAAKVMAFLPKEVAIEKSWQSYGLKATASHNMKVKNVTVPGERIFILEPEALCVDEALYRFPFESFARATLASTFWGIGSHFVHEAACLLRSKDEHTKVREKLIEKAEDTLYRVRRDLRERVQKAWQQCLEEDQPKQKAMKKITETTVNLVDETLKAAHELYRACGMAVLNEKSVINRAWRDLHTASQHIFLKE